MRDDLTVYAPGEAVSFARCRLRHDCVEGIEQGCTESAGGCELTDTESQGFRRAVGIGETNRVAAYVRKHNIAGDRQ